ncbi:MAG: DUF4062 domain-containing protein [Chloroflexi bacterium]|nr:DUF4062 domain-containing protein [Chloroflexota bacterium]
MSNNRKCVMISSTARDLPEHRKEVMDACLCQSIFPVMMEHLPASDDEAISASLKMVDEADIYLGVFAHRYGYVPKEHNPHQVSVTEMEYNRAVERNIPRCIFIMHDDHLLKASDIDIENVAKLRKLKERLQVGNVVNFFKSPNELRTQVINSLSKLRESQFIEMIIVLTQYSFMRSEEIATRREKLLETKIPLSFLWQIVRCAKCKRLLAIKRTKGTITYSHFHQNCPNSSDWVSSEKLHPRVIDLLTHLVVFTCP